MTIINPKSIAGVTSITTPSGSDNLFTVHTNNTTERFRIDSTGTASFGGDVSIGGTVSVGGTITYEDVTNVDSVGLITARDGIEIGARPGVAASISVDGNMIVSGISTFGGDVSIADKIVHTGDTNTAIRFSGADTITAETGGSERIRINSSGQLGLGASNNSDYDASAQNVLIASSGTTGITLRSGGSSYYGAIHFADGTSSSAEYRAGRILYEHSTDSLLFYNANTFAVKVDGSGNMGLGASSPTAASGETALHIYANEYPEVHLTSSVTGSNAGDGSIFTLNNDSSTIIRNQENSYIRFDTNGSNERARIEPAGNVKIEKNLNVVGVCTAATVNDSIGELRAFPVSSYTSNVVIAGHHAGKCLTNTSGGWTFNTDTNFAVGEVMRVVNKSGSSQIVYKGGGITLYSSRDSGTDGDHSIQARGSAIIICTATDEYYISGDI